jgi:hypothetical protein
LKVVYEEWIYQEGFDKIKAFFYQKCFLVQKLVEATNFLNTNILLTYFDDGNYPLSQSKSESFKR